MSVPTAAKPTRAARDALTGLGADAFAGACNVDFSELWYMAD